MGELGVSMSGQEDNPTNDGSQNPPSGDTQQTPPSNPPSNPQPNQPSGVDFSATLAAIQALPEQIANSVKEAVAIPKAPPARQTSAPTQSASSQSNSSSASAQNTGSTSTKDTDHQQPGKRKSFADWWFHG